MPSSVRSVIAVVAALVCVLAPASAHAANYCVGAPGGSCDGGTQPFTLAGFNQAVNDASGAPTASVVRVAEGTITGIGTMMLSSDVVIDGAGRDKTVLETTNVNGSPLYATGSGSGFTDLTLRSVAITSSATVVNVAGGATIARVNVTEASPQANNQLVTALALNGSSATDVAVKTNSEFDRGIDMSNAGTLTDVSVTGPGIMGIKVSGAGVTRTFDRVAVRGYASGLVGSSALALFIRDSLFDLGTATSARGFEVGTNGDADNIQASRVTIVGRGANQTGVYVDTSASGQSPIGGAHRLGRRRSDRHRPLVHRLRRHARPAHHPLGLPNDRA